MPRAAQGVAAGLLNVLRLNPRPRLHAWPAAAALIVFATAFAAGQWQSGRAQEKQVIETRHAALRDAPAVALPRSPSAFELEALDGRRIVARGEFVNDKTIFLDNQVLNRVAGYHVLTPFRAPDGTAVLVNRGWIATGKTRAELPLIVPVAGAVLIEGRAATPPQRIYEIKPDAQPGRVWQNLQLPAMSRQLAVDLLPFVLRLTSDTGDGLVRVAVMPLGNAGSAGMTADKHRGYAFQWYGLAALTAFLFLFFTFFERCGQHGQSA